MARKKQNKKMTDMERPKATKPIRLYITPEAHHQLRRVAANYDLSMSQWVADLVHKAIKMEAERIGLK